MINLVVNVDELVLYKKNESPILGIIFVFVLFCLFTKYCPEKLAVIKGILDVISENIFKI